MDNHFDTKFNNENEQNPLRDSWGSVLVAIFIILVLGVLAVLLFKVPRAEAEANAYSFEPNFANDNVLQIFGDDQTDLDLEGVSGYTIQFYMYMTELPSVETRSYFPVDYYNTYRFLIADGDDKWSCMSSSNNYTAGSEQTRWVVDTAFDADDLNEWHQVGCSVDFGTEVISFYLDGQPVNATETQNADNPGIGTLYSASSDRGFAVGGNYSLGPSATENFEGYIDEVAIFETSKSASYFSDNWTLPVDVNEPGLVSYWKMNAQDGVDETENNNDMDVVGSGSPWSAETPTLSDPPPDSNAFAELFCKYHYGEACTEYDYSLGSEGVVFYSEATSTDRVFIQYGNSTTSPEYISAQVIDGGMFATTTKDILLPYYLDPSKTWYFRAGIGDLTYTAPNPPITFLPTYTIVEVEVYGDWYEIDITTDGSGYVYYDPSGGVIGLYYPDTSSTSTSPWFVDCSAFQFSTSTHPMFDYVDLFGVDLIPVPTENFIHGTMCWAEKGFTGVGEALLRPRFAGSIWSNSLDRFKGTFPFSAFFAFENMVNENIATSSEPLTFEITFPAVASNPTITFPVLSATFWDDKIASSTKDTMFAGILTMVWIGAFAIILKTLL